MPQAQVDTLTLKFAEASPSSVAAAIAANGTDPISPGEAVLALEAGTVTMLALDASGTPRILAQGGVSPAGPGRFEATATLAPAPAAVASQPILEGVGRSGQVLGIGTSHAARVTLYESEAARDADAGRQANVPPVATSRVVADALTNGAEWLDAPGGVTYALADTAAGLYASVVPTAAVSSLVVTVRVLVLER